VRGSARIARAAGRRRRRRRARARRRRAPTRRHTRYLSRPYTQDRRTLFISYCARGYDGLAQQRSHRVHELMAAAARRRTRRCACAAAGYDTLRTINRRGRCSSPRIFGDVVGATCWPLSCVQVVAAVSPSAASPQSSVAAAAQVLTKVRLGLLPASPAACFNKMDMPNLLQ
jgi:hypothetical protein